MCMQREWRKGSVNGVNLIWTLSGAWIHSKTSIVQISIDHGLSNAAIALGYNGDKLRL